MGFGLASGCLAAGAMLAFVSRLKGPYLKLSPSVSYCLKGYAIMQALFPVFRIENMWPIQSEDE